MSVLRLFRPVGPKELALIADSGWLTFPPRLPERPIFYPVMNEEYATQIARDWNVPESGSGFVTAFNVNADYVRKFEVKTVGAAMHQELWVPAEELQEFNSNIIGKIQNRGVPSRQVRLMSTQYVVRPEIRL